MGSTSFRHNKDTPLSIPQVGNQDKWGHRKWAIALWRRDVGPVTTVHTNLWRYTLIFYSSVTTFNIGLSPQWIRRGGSGAREQDLNVLFTDIAPSTWLKDNIQPECPFLEGQAVMIPKRTMQVSKSGKKTIVLPSCDVYKPQQQTAWHHGGNLVGYCLTDNNY